MDNVRTTGTGFSPRRLLLVAALLLGAPATTSVSQNCPSGALCYEGVASPGPNCNPTPTTLPCLTDTPDPDGWCAAPVPQPCGWRRVDPITNCLCGPPQANTACPF